jgi:hypothetical protein
LRSGMRLCSCDCRLTKGDECSLCLYLHFGALSALPKCLQCHSVKYYIRLTQYNLHRPGCPKVNRHRLGQLFNLLLYLNLSFKLSSSPPFHSLLLGCNVLEHPTDCRPVPPLHRRAPSSTFTPCAKRLGFTRQPVCTMSNTQPADGAAASTNLLPPPPREYWQPQAFTPLEEDKR